MSGRDETIATINALPLKRLSAILKRIMERLAESAEARFFEDEELEKLAQLCDAEPRALREACDMLAYVFEQARARRDGGMMGAGPRWRL